MNTGTGISISLPSIAYNSLNLVVLDSFENATWKTLFDFTININSEQQRAMLIRIERKGWRNYTDHLEAPLQAMDSE